MIFKQKRESEEEEAIERAGKDSGDGRGRSRRGTRQKARGSEQVAVEGSRRKRSSRARRKSLKEGARDDQK